VGRVTSGKAEFSKCGSRVMVGVECFGEEAVFNPVDRDEFTAKIVAI